MLIRLIPSPPHPTVVFAITFENLKPGLPIPPFWANQLDHLSLHELEIPRNIHALDKSALVTCIIREISFDIPALTVTCQFIDGAIEEWPLTASTCVQSIEGVLELVNESALGIEREQEREKERVVKEEMEKKKKESESSTGHSTFSVLVGKVPKHKKQRSLLMTLVASIVSLSSSSSSSSSSSNNNNNNNSYTPPRIPSPPPTPIIPTAPPSAPSARALRRKARSSLVDMFRQHALAEITRRIPEGGYYTWIIQSTLRRISDRLSDLLARAGAGDPNSPLALQNGYVNENGEGHWNGNWSPPAYPANVTSNGYIEYGNHPPGYSDGYPMYPYPGHPNHPHHHSHHQGQGQGQGYAEHGQEVEYFAITATPMPPSPLYSDDEEEDEDGDDQDNTTSTSTTITVESSMVNTPESTTTWSAAAIVEYEENIQAAQDQKSMIRHPSQQSSPPSPSAPPALHRAHTYPLSHPPHRSHPHQHIRTLNLTSDELNEYHDLCSISQRLQHLLLQSHQRLQCVEDENKHRECLLEGRSMRRAWLNRDLLRICPASTSQHRLLHPPHPLLPGGGLGQRGALDFEFAVPIQRSRLSLGWWGADDWEYVGPAIPPPPATSTGLHYENGEMISVGVGMGVVDVDVDMRMQMHVHAAANAVRRAQHIDSDDAEVEELLVPRRGGHGGVRAARARKGMKGVEAAMEDIQTGVEGLSFIEEEEMVLEDDHGSHLTHDGHNHAEDGGDANIPARRHSTSNDTPAHGYEDGCDGQMQPVRTRSFSEPDCRHLTSSRGVEASPSCPSSSSAGQLFHVEEQSFRGEEVGAGFEEGDGLGDQYQYQGKGQAQVQIQAREQEHGQGFGHERGVFREEIGCEEEDAAYDRYYQRYRVDDLEDSRYSGHGEEGEEDGFLDLESGIARNVVDGNTKASPSPNLPSISNGRAVKITPPPLHPRTRTQSMYGKPAGSDSGIQQHQRQQSVRLVTPFPEPRQAQEEETLPALPVFPSLTPMASHTRTPTPASAPAQAPTAVAAGVTFPLALAHGFPITPPPAYIPTSVPVTPSPPGSPTSPTSATSGSSTSSTSSCSSASTSTSGSSASSCLSTPVSTRPSSPVQVQVHAPSSGAPGWAIDVESNTAGGAGYGYEVGAEYSALEEGVGHLVQPQFNPYQNSKVTFADMPQHENRHGHGYGHGGRGGHPNPYAYNHQDRAVGMRSVPITMPPPPTMPMTMNPAPPPHHQRHHQRSPALPIAMPIIPNPVRPTPIHARPHPHPLRNELGLHPLPPPPRKRKSWMRSSIGGSV